MTVLSCKDINKSYGIDLVLNKITFSVNEGDKVGFVGANGAGKSTLFKILTSELTQDSGELYFEKGKRVGYLSQNLSLQNKTIYAEMLSVFSELLNLEKKMVDLELKMKEPYDENNESYHNKLIKDYTSACDMYDIKGGYTYKGEISRILNGLGFMENDFYRDINILSGGQKTRVALCKLLLIHPDILLMDEPTNHLDLDAIEWLEDYLKSYKGTVIIISHDRFFLDAITNKTIELLNGLVYTYNGNYTQFIDLKKTNMALLQKSYGLQQVEIKRQEDIIKKYKSFNREKSVRAAESRQKALDKVERIDAPTIEHAISHFNFHPEIKSGNDVLYIKNLSKSFGDKLLFSTLNMDIKRENKIAIIGENGRGKTTLFKIIMDKIKADSGIKVLGKNVEIGYYDQEQSNLSPEKTILDEVWDAFPDLTVTRVRTALGAFLFHGDDVFKEVSALSGGEKCRINLLKLMLSNSNFLLLDEPTNHLDIMSREALEDALIGYDGTVLVISHDRYFLNKIITRIFELNISGINDYLGNYSYYIEKKKNPTRFQVIDENSHGRTRTQVQQEKKKKRDVEKEEKQKKLELKNLEKEIALMEEEIENLQSQLCLEEIYSNPTKGLEVNSLLSKTNDTLATLYEQWEDLV
ncbi:MAG: ABC-F family ATP-binding cassette domain-containing protein [Clostridium sp.]